MAERQVTLFTGAWNVEGVWQSVTNNSPKNECIDCVKEDVEFK